jgi:LacI family transcriptional regulator
VVKTSKHTTRPRRLWRVAVLIESSRAYGRELIAGIARYSRERGNWVLHFEPRGLEAPPTWLREWEGDGILARFPSPKAASLLPAFPIPVVDLYGTLTPTGFPLVATDNAPIAQLAFEHFREQGLRHFGFCGLRPGYWPYIEQRGDMFRHHVEAAGYTCAMFSVSSAHWAVADWEREEAQIAAWLQTLPKPIGILACYDERAYQLLNACRQIGLHVPDDVAVLGVGNDPVLCDMAMPPLSSIELDAQRIGYTAAARLDRMMRGRRQQTPLYLPPRGLTARRSTDVLAVEDPEMAEALRFIRDHACEGLRLRDVLAHVALSTSSLERKFRRLLGRTPKAEILRVQMARARRLLADSQLSLKEIAHACGFHNEKYFSDAFQRLCHQRPLAYRQEQQRVCGGYTLRG